MSASAPEREPVEPFAIFALTWAIGGLVHNGSTGDLLRVSVDILFSVAAWAVVLQPGSRFRFACMLLALMPSLWFHAPYITNHWTIYGFASAWLLFGFVQITLRGRALPSGAAWLEVCGPALRWATLIVYFWVVFHKLNATYFDPELSCAVEMYGWLAGKFGLPTAPWTAPFAIWGTLLAEGGIPVLLVIRRTRLLGILGGIGFHAMLGINGFFNFSAVVVALYMLFLSQEFGRQLVALRSLTGCDRIARLAARAARHPAALWGGAAIFVALMFVQDGVGWEPSEARRVSRFSTMAVWALYTGGLGGVVLLTAWLGRRPMTTNVSLRLRGAGWFVVALFLVNGASPYLGFKTENSFSMFANLRTEGPYWNHYVVPPGVRVFAFQDELVQVLGSSDPGLQRSTAEGGEIVFHEFRRHVSARPEISVVYRQGGQTFDVSRVADDARLAARPTGWERWLWFRPVQPPDRTICHH